MIEEMLKKIRETEETNAENKRAAEETAESIRREADANGAEIEEEASKNARAAYEGELTLAKKRADEEYSAAISDAFREGETITSSKEKTAEKIAAELLRGIKNGDL